MMIKRRQKWIDYGTLALVLFISMSVIVKTADNNRNTAIHNWALDAMGVLSRPVLSFRDHFKLRDENRRLKQRNIELQLENAALVAERSENARLRQLLDLKQNTEYKSIPARVIGLEGMMGVQSFVLDKGRADSVETDMPVISTFGVVGKIIQVSAHYSVVQTVTDKNFRIAARTRDSRIAGIFKGTGDQHALLWGVPLYDKVKPGEVVITSGLYSIFPASLVLGKVGSINKETGGLFYEIRIEPAEHYPQVEQVLILKSKPS